MEYSEAKKLVKARLSEKRWTHTKKVKNFVCHPLPYYRQAGNVQAR